MFISRGIFHHINANIFAVLIPNQIPGITNKITYYAVAQTGESLGSYAKSRLMVVERETLSKRKLRREAPGKKARQINQT